MEGDSDYSNSELSKLSIMNQQSASIDDTMNSDLSIPYSIKLGYAFQSQLPLEQLIDQRSIQSYLQGLLFMIEEKSKIYDFQMRLRNQDPDGFTVIFIHKDVNNYSGPVQYDECIFCDLNNKLSQISLIKQNPTTCIWLDIKLRNKLVVTPRQHIERLSEMSEEAMTSFWHDTQVLLDEEGCDWKSMVLNHGKYRHHAHFQMKINIDEYQWNERMTRKYEEKLMHIKHLLEYDEDNIT
ncbi:unnamed protein product [Rotaria socialis]|uniref:Uncharacterized protein n=1 Tax=Rotaria socialis TaxID=392032 RepID=A0A817S108_9BILA|nr:unnamed protein product [Rotaria socialis]CAF3375566.1 unnamed protein product [Rotaria socialis]CAF3654159.1 unnamed protein product [Rotaria socialis]CAF3684275.1 unnamed protein product [Rotaria socialis]CAF4254658.1 unnamed protein product [Rotaria socialis]